MKIIVKRSQASLTLECDDKTPLPMQDILCDLEYAIIDQMLDRCDGVKARTAERLMLNRTTLVEKAKKYGFPMKK